MARLDRYTLVAHSFGLVVLLMPFQWIALYEIADRSLKPVHIGLAAVAVGFFLIGRPFERLVAAARASDWFAVLFAIYVNMMLFALIWTVGPIAGGIIVFKQGMYFAVFLMLAGTVVGIPSDRMARAIRWAVPTGFLIFCAAGVLVFAMIGQNLFLQITAAIIRADPKFLQFGVYPVMFKLAGGKPQGEDAETFGTNLRNTLVGAFFLYMVLLNIYRPLWRTARMQLIATAFSLLGIMLILLSVSRSNALALAIALSIVAGIKLLRGWRPTMSSLVIGFAAMAVLFGGLMAAPGVATGALSIVDQRVSEVSHNTRIAMLQEVVQPLEEHPVRGSGINSTVPIAVGKDARMHNVFAVAWFEVGLWALVVAILFNAAIVIAWGRLIWRVIKYPDDWVIPVAPHWVAALPVLPLLRAQLSGGGAFTLIEWSCLALFFGLIARNRMERRARDAASAAPGSISTLSATPILPA
jgi:hypothetical protein